MTPQRIVVTGGTGFVGRTLLAHAVALWPGARFVVPTRRPASSRDIWTLPQVQLVRCNVHDGAQLPPLFDGADALVHLVAVLHGDAARFERVHVELPRTLAAAARRAGVARVVHISALGVAADAPSLYLRSKAAGEAAWRDSGLPLTVLRPSVMFGAEDRFTNLFATLLRRFPVLPLAGAEALFQPVWVDDVAAAVIAGLSRPELAGKTIECAGPDVMTLREIVHRVGRMAGCDRPIVGLPEAVGRLQAALLALLPGDPPLSADNLKSMRVPSVATGKLPGLPDIGIRPEPLQLLVDHFAARRR